MTGRYSDGVTTTSNTSPLPATAPALRVLLTLAAATVTLLGVHLAQDLLTPLALALVIVIICEPIRRPLERRGWPRWTASTAVIVLSYLILAAMGVLLWIAGAQFVKLIESFASAGLPQPLTDLMAWLQSAGLDEGAADAAASLLDPKTLLSIAGSVWSTMLGVATALFFVCAYVIMMAVDGARYRDAPRLFGAVKGATMSRISNLTSGTRRYYVVNASFGAIVAIIDGLALWWLGVPAPVVWAVLAFVTNFIPNIGFIVGLVPPAILAFLVGGWPLMLGVVAIYCVVNVTLQVLIQPKFVSDAVGLSLTITFFSVVFWTFIIGPLGAILSIPLTLFTRMLLFEADPQSTWLRWLSGDRDAVPEQEDSPDGGPESASESTQTDPDDGVGPAGIEPTTSTV
ncbi:AI-2E family transporter [Microbacterium sp. H1-D42]|uniref:AI-2E family transporter n=1 Tax=Microbacterium sp. H1-D42 TaxID=2925844 RepID=UPI00321FDB9C